MEIISRMQVEIEGWIPSIGIPLDKEHFREPPPGKRHAIFELGKQYGAVHYDQHNPHEGLDELVKHLWNWNPIGTLLLGYTAYKFLK